MSGKRLALLVIALLVSCGMSPGFAHEVAYNFFMDGELGWARSGPWSWTAVDHCGGGLCPGDWGPHSGAGFYGHGISNRVYDTLADTLTTTPLDLRGWENATLTFWRRLGHPPDPDDHASLQASNDGVNWTTVWEAVGEIMDTEWVFCSYDISAIADNQPKVYVRWVQGPTDKDGIYSWGWDIDDVQIVGDPVPYTEPPSLNELIYNVSLSFDPYWLSFGDWQYGPGADCCVTSAHTGTNWYSHKKDTLAGSDGRYSEFAGEQTLTTGSPFGCTGLSNVHLGFWRQLGLANGETNGDRAAIQVSANGSPWTTVWESRQLIRDEEWRYVEYDISEVADNQPYVQVRWVMGPTDMDGCTCFGWNIDDVQITATTAQPPLRILAWVKFADVALRYLRTVGRLSELDEPSVVTESYTMDPATLAAELDGKQVLLVPAPVNATSGQLAAAGAAFAEVLQEFVEDGGTVIVCGEAPGWSGFVSATGLMSVTPTASYGAGETLTTVYPSSALAYALPSSFEGSDATDAYSIGPESTAVVEDSAGNAVLAFRDIGFGAAVMVGFDYFGYNVDSTQVLLNALEYPRSTRYVLVYEDGASHNYAEQAVRRLHLPYRLGCADEVDCALTMDYWDAAVLHLPAEAADGATFGTTIPDFVAANGKIVLSAADLSAQSEVAAAFGVSGVTEYDTPQTVYRWAPTDSLFTTPASVPDLTEWDDLWPTDGTGLAVIDPTAEALAGFSAVPATNQAAIVVGHEGRTILNSFLWDDFAADEDEDGVTDCVELIMNEVKALVRRPEADFSAAFTGTYGPLPVSFTDLSGNHPTAWDWDFGDGATSAEQNPVHVYTGVGSFTVSLTAGNAYNHDTETKPDLIVVTAVVPEASFSASATSGAAPLEVSFTDLSTNAPTFWAWDFGDGAGATDEHPVHTYAAVGTYSVSLTAANPAGSDTETKADYIHVLPELPVAAFSAAPTAGGPPLTVAFTDESTGAIEAWAWDFGDGATSTEQDPGHEYAGLGSYDVSLTVSNVTGSDTKTKEGYIQVVEPVAAAFSASVTAGIVPLAVSFSDLSTGGPTAWAWDFGDGDTSTQQSPSHSYTDPGYYTVSLTATKGVAADIETKVGLIAAGFIDTPPDHWAFYSILACASSGIVQGYEDDTYRPGDVVSRAQMAVYVSRALAGGDEAVPEPMVAEPSFTDVPADYWAYRYVEYVAALDVVQGYPGGLYRPESAVNRGQMAVYIARSVCDPVGDAGVPDPPLGEPLFPDVTTTNDWAWCYRYVEYIAGLGIVQGYSDGTYHPEVEVTRDQMAVYIQRAFDLPVYPQ